MFTKCFFFFFKLNSICWEIMRLFGSFLRLTAKENKCSIFHFCGSFLAECIHRQVGRRYIINFCKDEFVSVLGLRQQQMMHVTGTRRGNEWKVTRRKAESTRILKNSVCNQDFYSMNVVTTVIYSNLPCISLRSWARVQASGGHVELARLSN